MRSLASVVIQVNGKRVALEISSQRNIPNRQLTRQYQHRAHLLRPFPAGWESGLTRWFGAEQN